MKREMVSNVYKYIEEHKLVTWGKIVKLIDYALIQWSTLFWKMKGLQNHRIRGKLPQGDKRDPLVK